MLWLTIGIVLTTEALAFIPGIARERQRWMLDRFAQADLAILLVSGSPGGQTDAQTREALLRRAGVDEIHLVDSGKQLIGVGSPTPTGRRASRCRMSRTKALRSRDRKATDSRPATAATTAS